MNDVARVFQSLDDETRLRILTLLLQEQELCVCDIMSVLQLPQSTVSRHLSLLKNAGWLADRRVGLWVYYSLVKQPAPLQQTLLPILRHFLHENPTAQADLERLRNIRAKRCCC